MSDTFTRDQRRVAVAGLATSLPLLVWWLGWYPGFMSPDSVDQWGQVVAFDFRSAHPILHTWAMWVVSTVWESPAAVGLVQVAATTALLTYIGIRLHQIGVRWWLTAGIITVIAWSPMAGAMTVAIWKDVPFTLAMGWAFAELIALAHDPERFWSSRWGSIRLGLALGLMWGMRANGKHTVIVFLVALAIAYRHRWRRLITLGATAIAVGAVLPTVLLTTLPVVVQPIEPAQVFMPDVGSVLVHHREALSDGDLALISAVAPIEVWEELYDCGNSSPLVFDPRYDNAVVQGDPWPYRRLVVRAAMHAPATVAGHRWCAGEYLLSPYNRTGTYVHRPPFEIWENDLGLTRSPLSDVAYDVTLKGYDLAARDEIIWLTWRPALAILAGIATFAAIALRPPLRPLLWTAAVFGLHLANVFITSPSHEFRYAYGLWLIAMMTLPLWDLVVHPDRARIGPAPAIGTRPRSMESSPT